LNGKLLHESAHVTGDARLSGRQTNAREARRGWVSRPSSCSEHQRR
jgi:hypothetical protein